jgi:hypothetical protein
LSLGVEEIDNYAPFVIQVTVLRFDFDMPNKLALFVYRIDATLACSVGWWLMAGAGLF